jgi:hypothetical protein
MLPPDLGLEWFQLDHKLSLIALLPLLMLLLKQLLAWMLPVHYLIEPLPYHLVILMLLQL